MKTFIILLAFTIIVPLLADSQLSSGILSTPQLTTANPKVLELIDFVYNSTCLPSETISTNQKRNNFCSGDLIFEETFETNELNSTVWYKEIRIPSDYDDADFVSYQDLPENCYIKDNHLHIVPTLLENTNSFDMDSIRTARIGTRQSFSFRYGRIEIKAKLPKGDWIFPQLLLEPYSTSAYGDKGYASGQVRVAFIRSNDVLDNKNDEQIDGYRLFGGVVLTVGEENREKLFVNTLRRKHLGDDFHKYSMVWTNESMTFYLDGTPYGQINGGFSNDRSLRNLKESEKWKSGDFMSPFDQEFFISLGVSAGGISDFPDGSKNGVSRSLKPWTNKDPKAELKFWNDRTNWNQTWSDENAGLKVDYIRVWAL